VLAWISLSTLLSKRRSEHMQRRLGSIFAFPSGVIKKPKSAGSSDYIKKINCFFKTADTVCRN
jgi:hypothetical protein